MLRRVDRHQKQLDQKTARASHTANSRSCLLCPALSSAENMLKSVGAVIGTGWLSGWVTNGG
eukprot:SAG31_NODE_11807_length_996_cov_1.528428_1_plen_61_part_01